MSENWFVEGRLEPPFLPATTTLLALGLRLYRLGAQSLWLDEAFTVFVANRSILDIVLSRLTVFKFHPMVLWPFMVAFGISEFSARLPSVLAGVLSVVLVYAIAIRLFDKSVGRFAAFILAISPFHVWYSQEARPYALLIAVSLASVWFFLDLLEKPSRSSLAGYVLTTILAMCTQVYSSLFLILFQNLCMLWPWRKRAGMKYKWIAAQVIILALTAIFVAHFLYFSGLEMARTGGQHEVDLIALPYAFFAYSLGFSVGPSLAELHLSRSLDLLLPYISVLLPASIVFALPFLLGLYSMIRDKSHPLFVFLYLFVPILGALVISQLFNQFTYNPRYVAVALPAYVIVLAKGVTSIKRRGLQLLLTLLIVAFSAYALANYYFDTRYAKEDARSTAEYLEKAAEERDVIVVLEITHAIEYYYRGPAETHGIHRPQLENIVGLHNKLSQIASDHDRLWLVWSRPWVDPEASLKHYLDERYRIIDQQDFHGVQVYGYDLKES